MKRVLLPLLSFIISFQLLAQESPLYEFRAVWIATVENIDWPSKRGLPVAQQKAEFTRILDLHQRNGMNAIVMQIRPVTDAFYPSKYEPWSEYLNGKQGLPPNPYYDPLSFMIEECHKRGMEFHAWCNPYRAVFNVTRSSVAPSHVTRLFPQWFVTYGNTKYFDPGIPQAREHVARVIRDIVERYDLDGIHFDDYFYPYPIAGKEFPDAVSYLKFGNGMPKDAWRRSNVDTIIKMISENIKTINPRVKFGISPFGIWRNKSKDERGSPSKGLSNYDDLYADILLWMQKGWIDYAVPQLYWQIGHPTVDYKMLLDWWANNTFGKQLYIGHGIYRTLEAASGPWKLRSQIPEQIKYLRQNPNVQGSVYFSSKTFNSNPNGWNDTLRNNYYKYPALPPPMKWIDDVAPLAPLFEKIESNKYRLFYRGAEPIKGFAIFTVEQGKQLFMENARFINLIVADKVTDLSLQNLNARSSDRIMVATVDRNNNVSDWEQLR